MLAFLKKYNTQTILFSVFLSIVCGLITPNIFPRISFLGDIFINLLKLFALPLIMSALIAVMGSMSDSLARLKSLARDAVIYMVISEIIAVSIAITLFHFLKPGSDVSPQLILQGHPYVPLANGHGLSIENFMVSIFPDNIFGSLAHFNLLPVVVFSILFGIGCAIVGNASRPIVNIFIAIREVSNTCLHGVMLLAPIGIFALVGTGIAESSVRGNLSGDFTALISFVLVLLLGLLLHGLWQLILVCILTKQNFIQVLRQSIPVFSTAFATSSSVATLPIAMDTADSLKSRPYATRFMLPLCASINIGGMMMYEVAAALFFAQVLHLHLPLSQQILMAVACILGGMAEGGIPETSMVSLVVVFKIVNIPLSAISILLPLDRIIDRFRTMVNIFGNMCGVIIVSKFLKDEEDREHDAKSEEKAI